MFDAEEMSELHTKLSILAAIDIGIVVIDRYYEISMWNEFMANHSGKRPSEILGKNLFEVAPEIEQTWFVPKLERTFKLGHRNFIIWEQKHYLFRFLPYRPVTGLSHYMYQNITLLPLNNILGEVEHIALLVYDVTDTAEASRAEAAMRRRVDKPFGWAEI